MAIKSVHAREILDSRGNPTVEATIVTEIGSFTAKVPSGASTGEREACELRDGDAKRYGGKGVLKAVKNVNEVLGPAVVGKDPTEQAAIDKQLMDVDGTEYKSKYGANAILAISMAVAKAGAAQLGLPLYKYLAKLAGVKDFVMPVPAFNVINGGVHAGNKLAPQEFKILPIGAPSFTEALRYGAEIYHTLKGVIKHKYGLDATNVGDEGGFAPDVSTFEEALGLLVEAIDTAGYKGKVVIGVDSAASSFYAGNGIYDLDFKNPQPDPKKKLTGEQMIAEYETLLTKFPLVSIEDPFDENDWDNFTKLTAKVPQQIILDDIVCTNPKRIREAIHRKAGTCLLLKVNQIGTVSESLEACQLAQAAGWGVMVSHRSGETDDSFIADLAVGFRCGQIKSGAPCRSERLAKYNRLMQIEEELAADAKYPGPNFRTP